MYKVGEKVIITNTNGHCFKLNTIVRIYVVNDTHKPYITYTCADDNNRYSPEYIQVLHSWNFDKLRKLKLERILK
jgi:hypothetical protein